MVILVIGHVGHGSRGSWVSSLMDQMGHGSENVTRCHLCLRVHYGWRRPWSLDL